MYVNNGKISSRQTFRLYVFDLLGIATLLLPPYLARMCGVGGIYAIVLGTVAGFVYLLYLGWIMKQMGTDMVNYLESQVHPWIGRSICVFIMIHSVLTAGFCAYVFANLMQYSLVQETSYIAIMVLIVIVAAYAVSGGIESRARVYEVLFWFVLIPYFLMMLASIREFEFVYITPLPDITDVSLLKGAYLVFLLLTPLFFCLFLIGEKEKNYGRNIIKTIAMAVLFTGSILLASYVILLGNFGVESLKQLRFPVVTLMSTIQFEGNFLRRMDALMLAVWFFTLYALLNLHLHYGVRMLADLTSKDKGKRKGWHVVLPTWIVFITAYVMHKNSDLQQMFLQYYSYVAVPFIVVVPGFLLMIRRRK